jgi:hypothetical protein
MELNKRYYAPFDRTYADVTKRIASEADLLTAPDAEWLRRLVLTFSQERERWNDRAELSAYRTRWMHLRSRILRLVAGAYLHIGYDLPRALADDWPGSGSWKAGPNAARGQDIYFRLRTIFPESLVRSSRDLKTIGLPALLLRAASRRALTGAAIWVDNLRQGAWIHASILDTAPDRPVREAAMARAMTASLEDVSLLHPWSILHLGPPHDAFFTPGWVSVTMLLSFLHEFVELIWLAFFSSYATRLWIDDREQLSTTGDFVYAWGALLTDYLAIAVREPEGFDGYRAQRQQELGVDPNLGMAPL